MSIFKKAYILFPESKKSEKFGSQQVMLLFCASRCQEPKNFEFIIQGVCSLVLLTLLAGGRLIGVPPLDLLIN